MAEKELYRQPVLKAVNLSETKRLAEKIGLNIPETELAQYTEILKQSIVGAEKLYDLPDIKPPVLYPRTPGHRPQPQDNTHNAWYYKTEIKGEATGILAGKRVVIKDNIAVAGVPMMCGSRLLEGHVPDYDATVVTRILQQGGTIVGKAVCENLTCSGGSFSSSTGPVLNPHNTKCTSGGSSSGSAVLVAAEEADMSIGSDTAGSIRQPAAYCGIVGLKPTFGLVPYTGTMTVAPAFDHLGPMARTVTDCAALLQAIAGRDEFDYKQGPHVKAENYLEKLEDGIQGLNIGMLTEGLDNCEQDIKSLMQDVVVKLWSLGCEVTDVSNPNHNLASATLNVICATDVYKNMIDQGGVTIGTGGWQDAQLSDRFQSALKLHPEDIPPQMNIITLIGAYYQDTDRLRSYAKAQSLIPMIRKSYDDLLSKYDVLVMPTTTSVAPHLPDRSGDIQGLVKAVLSFKTNLSQFNLTGHPAITVNAGIIQAQSTKRIRVGRSPRGPLLVMPPDDQKENGETPELLPFGIMFVGKHFDEAKLLRVARAFEKLSLESEQ